MNETLERLAPVWTPHPGQREFLLNPSKFKVLACGRRWGKTDACAAQIVASLFQDEPARHVLIAPTQDQANLLFDRVLDLLDKLLGEGTRKSKDLKIRRTPYPRLNFGRHRVTARSGHMARSLRGNEATDLVIDEAAFVPESLITEVALPMLATTHGRLTLISTPRGKNHFWRFFQFGQEGKHGVWSRSAPSIESPFVSAEFLEIQRELVSDRAYRVEYLAEFMDSAGQVFRTEALEACVVAVLPAAVGELVVGIDFARYHDNTAIAVLQGDHDLAILREMVSLPHVAWIEQIERIVAVVEHYPKAQIVCDATGVGSAIVEMLKKALPERPIKEFTFTAPSKDKLIDTLAGFVERGALKMCPAPDLMRELHHFEATDSATGPRKLGAPQGMHDDRVIALALAASLLSTPYRARVRPGNPRTFSHSQPLSQKRNHDKIVYTKTESAGTHPSTHAH